MKEYALGIDIGGTNIVCGVVDRQGNILVEDSFITADFPRAGNMVDAVFAKFKEMKTKLAKNDKMTGIGVGAPNGNYYSGCIEQAPNLKWKGSVPLAEMFRKKFRLPVFLTNDANAAALGEMIFGGARNMRDFIVITIGTGLGSGIVCNGQIVYGHDGFAGELGHTIVYPQGRLCGCGRFGCLETYVSAGGLGKTIGEMLNFSRHKSRLRDIPPGEITAYMVYEAALRKDKIAIEAFDFTGRILGMKLADAVALTSPEAIFLFGGVCRAGDYIIRPTKKSMEEHLLPVFRNKVKVLKSELLDKNAAVLGAAAMVWAELEK